MSIEDDAAEAAALKDERWQAWQEALAAREELTRGTDEWTAADMAVRSAKALYDGARSRATRLRSIVNRRNR